MDWGLFRSSAKGKYMLRKDLAYSPWFYYFAMVVNTLLRFFWVLGLVKWSFEDDQKNIFDEIEILVISTIFAEALRRTQWSLLRVENEFYNNFEMYRTIPFIPNLMDEVDAE